MVGDSRFPALSITEEAMRQAVEEAGGLEMCEWEEMDNMVGHQGYGALDTKVTTSRLLSRGQEFWAVAGPTHDDKTPPFSWSNTNLTDKPFYSPISTFDFQPQVHSWLL